MLKSNDPASEKQLFLSRMRIESMNPNSGKRRGKSRGQTEKRARMRSALLACGVSLQLRHDGRKGAEKRPARDGERCRGEEEKQGHSPVQKLYHTAIFSSDRSRRPPGSAEFLPLTRPDTTWETGDVPQKHGLCSPGELHNAPSTSDFRRRFFKWCYVPHWGT